MFAVASSYLDYINLEYITPLNHTYKLQVTNARTELELRELLRQASRPGLCEGSPFFLISNQTGVEGL